MMMMLMMMNKHSCSTFLPTTVTVTDAKREASEEKRRKHAWRLNGEEGTTQAMDERGSMRGGRRAMSWFNAFRNQDFAKSCPTMPNDGPTMPNDGPTIAQPWGVEVLNVTASAAQRTARQAVTQVYSLTKASIVSCQIALD